MSQEFKGWIKESRMLNDRDFLLNRVRDPRARASLIVPLLSANELEQGALAGNFHIVFGKNAFS